MKTFKQYLSESEMLAETPVVGDGFDINIREEMLIETVIIGELDEGIVLHVDDTAWDLLESYGMFDEEYCDECGLYETDCACDHEMDEAKYQGREVQLGKPMAGDVKKSKVYVRGPKGNVVKVNFGDKKMRIKKSNPKRRKSFRARHNCANPGPRWKARYWSCRAW